MTEAETAVREAMAKMTPGQWEAHQGIDAHSPTVWDITSKHGWNSFAGNVTPQGWFVATVHEVNDASGAAADAAGIVALKNHTPALLAELDAARAEVAWLREAIAETVRRYGDSPGMAFLLGATAVPQEVMPHHIEWARAALEPRP